MTAPEPQKFDKQRFFIALVPPVELQAQVNEIKQYFSDRYASSAAFRSPPHITLQAPFLWDMESLPLLQDSLTQFASEYTNFSVTLRGFAAFVPRVIYINVDKTSALLNLQADLANYLETQLSISDPQAKSRVFVPHMTVAFRDLTKPNFHQAWAEFQFKSFQGEFAASQLTLLIYKQPQWQIASEYALQANE